jgi:DNA-binding NarL/FixJ family response regulator
MRTAQPHREATLLSESTVEKHVSAIFSKLGLSEEKGIDRRVAAVLAFLREADSIS